ncbi:MAG: TlyA family RNA methyltransferase [Aminobacteriaceae bacterium]
MKSSKKERIDRVLASRGLAESRTAAQSLLMAGRVSVGGVRVDKPGAQVSPDADIEVKGGADWVSRGALKLIKALDYFEIVPKGRVCVDVGASTGGFTQVLLSRGAARVYSVDVGYGQLAWTIRNDERVVVMERTNARNLHPEDFDQTPDISVTDASFISLRLLLPAMDAFLSPSGEAVVLVKPQFEVGRGRVGKGGRVRSREDHIEVLEGIISFCTDSPLSLVPSGLTFSPITGAKGNIEFLMFMRKGTDYPVPAFSAAAVVDEAHHFFSEERGEP